MLMKLASVTCLRLFGDLISRVNKWVWPFSLLPSTSSLANWSCHGMLCVMVVWLAGWLVELVSWLIGWFVFFFSVPPNCRWKVWSREKTTASLGWQMQPLPTPVALLSFYCHSLVSPMSLPCHSIILSLVLSPSFPLPVNHTLFTIVYFRFLFLIM